MHRNLVGLVRRKPILSLVVGAVAFSTALAFAATLGVSSDNLGAGNAAVSSCDNDGVSVAYSPSYDGGAFKVSEVTVSGIAAGCGGLELAVEVVNGAGVSLANGTATIEGTSASVSLSTAAPAKDVANVHAVIAG